MVINYNFSEVQSVYSSLITMLLNVKYSPEGRIDQVISLKEIVLYHHGGKWIDEVCFCRNHSYMSVEL